MDVEEKGTRREERRGGKSDVEGRGGRSDEEEGGTGRKEGQGGRRDKESEKRKKLLKKMKKEKVAKGCIIGLAGPCFSYMTCFHRTPRTP